jgi:hypothetical protein
VKEQEIINNKPLNATHVTSDSVYLREYDGSFSFWSDYHQQWESFNKKLKTYGIRSLSDIERIAELERDRQALCNTCDQLESWNDELEKERDQILKSALDSESNYCDLKDSLPAHNLEQQAIGIEEVRFSRVDAVELLRLQGCGHSFEDELLVYEELKIAEKILILKSKELREQAKGGTS